MMMIMSRIRRLTVTVAGLDYEGNGHQVIRDKIEPALSFTHKVDNDYVL
jgi:aspartate 1-decarboxylase